MATNGNEIPSPPPIDVWGGDVGGNVHYFVRHPWQWVMKAIASNTMKEAVSADELPSARFLLNTPAITPATRRRREVRKFKGPSTLKIEISDHVSGDLLFAVHGSSTSLDGLEDKDELVRTLQRCRCEHLNLSPPSVLLSWDVTHEECINVIGHSFPVLAENNSDKKYGVLKEPMGSQGKGIYFVLDSEEIHKIIEEQRQRAQNENGFLDNLIAMKGRIPSWVLQAEVYPSLLIRDRRKFHIRTYVVVMENLRSENMVDIYIFKRHEVRVAGLPVDSGELDRDRLSHITNGALSDTTERCLIEDVAELVDRGASKLTEVFVASMFGKYLLADLQRRVSLSSSQVEPYNVEKFALAGLDIMMTEDNRMYLLEVNSNPAAPPEAVVSDKFKEHLTGFMHDLVDLVVGIPTTNFLLIDNIIKENGINME